MTVDVHPVQHDFDEVLTAAAAMKTDVPDEMVVGKQYLVTASMSMAGHADTVSADIHLGPGRKLRGGNDRRGVPPQPPRPHEWCRSHPLRKASSDGGP